MQRYLLQIGPITLYSYGAMLALAFMAATYLATKRAQRAGIESTKIIDLSLYILLSSILGARIMFVALNRDYYKERLLDIFKLWEGGLVFYGGLICAFFAVVWVLRKNRLPVWKTTDILSAPIALGIAIGRMGCFLNGCCYGKISFAYGICFPAKDNPPAFTQQVLGGLVSPQAACSLPVIPTQLYESVAYLLIFFLLLCFEKHKHFAGFSFWMLILLYSFFRFIIEGFRYYDTNFVFGAFTVSQLISVILFIIALPVLMLGARKAR
jgi:phosphatidylglycerol:prolipoprotein diacylglycerol transferase